MNALASSEIVSAKQESLFSEIVCLLKIAERGMKEDFSRRKEVYQIKHDFVFLLLHFEKFSRRFGPFLQSDR